jgi:alkyldihydroxyacetonephosphate synthase
MDIGVLAETLETATTWANLPHVKDAVTSALTESLTAAGTKPIVLCHISHVYPAGASLYFTVVAALAEDPQTQWRRAKDAASRAIGDAQATITHHHAVGRDHRPYLAAEIGDLGVEILRAVKATLDPHGIMNPGALVPPGSGVPTDGGTAPARTSSDPPPPSA